MTYVSYYEATLEDGDLMVRLGAGPSDEILERAHRGPSIRICVQEPADGSVRFRARCGTATITPEALVPNLSQDPSEWLGAWVRLIPIGRRVWAGLKNGCKGGQLEPAIREGLSTGWLRFAEDAIKAADTFSVRVALGESVEPDHGASVFIRLVGTPKDVIRISTLMNAASEGEAGTVSSND